LDKIVLQNSVALCF